MFRLLCGMLPWEVTDGGASLDCRVAGATGTSGCVDISDSWWRLRWYFPAPVHRCRRGSAVARVSRSCRVPGLREQRVECSSSWDIRGYVGISGFLCGALPRELRMTVCLPVTVWRVVRGYRVVPVSAAGCGGCAGICGFLCVGIAGVRRLRWYLGVAV